MPVILSGLGLSLTIQLDNLANSISCEAIHFISYKIVSFRLKYAQIVPISNLIILLFILGS